MQDNELTKCRFPFGSVLTLKQTLKHEQITIIASVQFNTSGYHTNMVEL